MYKFIGWIILALFGLGTFSVVASDPTVAAKIQRSADTITVLSGGTLTIASGATLTKGGNNIKSGGALTIASGATLAVASGATFTDATTSTLSGTKNVTSGGVLNVATGGSVTVADGGSLLVANTATTEFKGLVTLTKDVTIGSTDVLAVTSADKLTVGGNIVPTTMVIPFHIVPHASLLTDTIFYAQTNGWTVTGVVVVMDLVDDTAITASICKVAGNNVAVAATTPLHSGTFNMQTTAGTPQVGALTSTGADLILAATDKIGIIFTGAALDVGVVSGFIRLKRS